MVTSQDSFGAHLLEAPDGDLLAAVVGHYVEALGRSDDARAWLAARGVTDETAARWSVGFSDRTLGLVLPEGNRRAGALLRSRLRGSTS
jgi:hypothetical protein